MLGSSVWRRLERDGHELIGRSRTELDLRDPLTTRKFLEDIKPDAVVLAAARVGGIVANRDHPAEFLAENLAIQLSVIQGAHEAGVERLLFIASAAIYPAGNETLREESLLTGPLEPNVEPYALAKIAGIKLCDAYRRQYGRRYSTVAPTNMYGPGDNYDQEHSHVVAGMIRRFHTARARGEREVQLWGTGRPRRELLYVDDAADAVAILLAADDSPNLVNLPGFEVSICELADRVAEVTGFDGAILWDESKPDGAMRKAMDGSKMDALGWIPSTELGTGLVRAYADFRARMESGEIQV